MFGFLDEAEVSAPDTGGRRKHFAKTILWLLVQMRQVEIVH